MATLAAIRTALAGQVDNVSGLRTHTQWPDVIMCPAALFLLLLVKAKFPLLSACIPRSTRSSAARNRTNAYAPLLLRKLMSIYIFVVVLFLDAAHHNEQFELLSLLSVK